MTYQKYDEEKLSAWAYLRQYVPTINRYVLANVYDEEYGQRFRENDIIQVIAPLISYDLFRAQRSLYTESSMRICAKKTKTESTYTWYRLYYTTDKDDTNKCIFDSDDVRTKFEKIVKGPINKYFDQICNDLGLDPKYFFRNLNKEFNQKYHEFWDYENFGNLDHPSFQILSEIRQNLAEWIIESIKKCFPNEDVIITIEDDYHLVFSTKLEE